MRKKGTLLVFAVALLLAAAMWPSVKAQSEIDQTLMTMMDTMNARLAAEGVNYRVAVADYLTTGVGGIAGGTVLSKVVGDKQLDSDFVPHDPQREWSGPADGPTDDITWAVDQTIDATPLLGGLNSNQTTVAIENAVATWDNVGCSTLPLTRNPDYGLDIGLVAYLNGLGGSPFIFADVQHAGFRDLNFAAPGILAVTFGFIFLNDDGTPSDVDANGKLDTALNEIYYDPSFPWRNNGGNVDVETVALHEFGHALSQDHFGTVRLKNDGSLQASPRAVMNALYSGPLRVLQGPDIGGHCSIWEDWPTQ